MRSLIGVTDKASVEAKGGDVIGDFDGAVLLWKIGSPEDNYWWEVRAVQLQTTVTSCLVFSRQWTSNATGDAVAVSESITYLPETRIVKAGQGVPNSYIATATVSP